MPKYLAIAETGLTIKARSVPVFHAAKHGRVEDGHLFYPSAFDERLIKMRKMFPGKRAFFDMDPGIGFLVILASYDSIGMAIAFQKDKEMAGIILEALERQNMPFFPCSEDLTIDQFYQEYGIVPDVIKLRMHHVEGAQYVIERFKPNLIFSTSEATDLEYFTNLGYVTLFPPEGNMHFLTFPVPPVEPPKVEPLEIPLYEV